jgi:23S rRNA pseudouridine2605 synthase
LALAGLASRRGADALIQAGRVGVNGVPVATMGFQVDPFVDKVTVDGSLVEVDEEKQLVLALNKPVGVVSTMRDDRGRACLGDYVDAAWGRVFHVGRLDRESGGLLILSNRGDLAYQLAHPKHEIQKTYLVDVLVSNKDLFAKRVSQGVALADGVAVADQCLPLDSPSPSRSATRFRWQIHDGRNRVIRRVSDHLGARVINLHRVAIGNYLMGVSTPGQISELTPQETKEWSKPTTAKLFEQIQVNSAVW